MLLQTQTDERLAVLAGGGHAAAFTVIVERHRRSLFRVALGIVSVGEADDVLQQSLLQAWTALQRGAQVGHVRGWLHQIVRHVAIKHRATPVAWVELDEASQIATSVAPDADTRLRMRELLANVAALPDNQRAALLRCAVDGEAQADVAGEMRTTESAVRQLLYRARASLRAAATAVVPLPVLEWLVANSAPVAAGGSAVGGAAGSGLLGGLGLGGAGKVAASVAVIATSVSGVHHLSPQIHDSGSRPTASATRQAPGLSSTSTAQPSAMGGSTRTRATLSAAASLQPARGGATGPDAARRRPGGSGVGAPDGGSRSDPTEGQPTEQGAAKIPERTGREQGTGRRDRADAAGSGSAGEHSGGAEPTATVRATRQPADGAGAATGTNSLGASGAASSRSSSASPSADQPTGVRASSASTGQPTSVEAGAASSSQATSPQASSPSTSQPAGRQAASAAASTGAAREGVAAAQSADPSSAAADAASDGAVGTPEPEPSRSSAPSAASPAD